MKILTLKKLAEIEGVTKKELMTMLQVAYIESNASTREKLYAAGFTEYNY